MSPTADMSRDAWRYTKAPKPEDLKENRYLNPPKESPKHVKKSVSSVGFLKIGPLTCYDSDGNPFEHHDDVRIAKDVARDPPSGIGSTKKFPKVMHCLDAILYCESENMLLPSFALTCAALNWLYDNKDKPTARAILEQYFSQSFVNLNFNQNSKVDTYNGIVAHYPFGLNDGSFNGYTLKTANIGIPQIELPFKIPPDLIITLEAALVNLEYMKSIRNLTGLLDPYQLIRISELFFRREVKIFTRKEPGQYFTSIGGVASFSLSCGSYYDHQHNIRGFTVNGGGISK